MEWIILLIILAIYFVPSLVALSKRNLAGIIILNLFLGWTLVGWVGALVWAVCEKEIINEEKKC